MLAHFSDGQRLAPWRHGEELDDAVFRVRLIERLRHLLRVEAASAQTTVTQRIPQVTADEVQRVVCRDFSADEYASVMAILSEYGTEKWHRETTRVQLAALKVGQRERGKAASLCCISKARLSRCVGCCRVSCLLQNRISSSGTASGGATSHHRWRLAAIRRVAEKVIGERLPRSMSTMAFHEKAGRSQREFWIHSEFLVLFADKVFSCRVSHCPPSIRTQSIARPCRDQNPSLTKTA
jgi:hypothetical protein